MPAKTSESYGAIKVTMTTNEQDVHCIRPEDLVVFRNESKNLCVRVEGRGDWEKVVVKLAFPYSDPEHFVVLSQEEEEIGVVRDLQDVEEQSRALLKEMLAKRYHIPQIQRILSIEEIHNATRWTVETNRGRRTFEVRNSDNFRWLKDGAIVVIDVEANRFRISAPGALDKESRRLLDSYL